MKKTKEGGKDLIIAKIKETEEKDKTDEPQRNMEDEGGKKNMSRHEDERKKKERERERKSSGGGGGRAEVS